MPFIFNQLIYCFKLLKEDLLLLEIQNEDKVIQIQASQQIKKRLEMKLHLKLLKLYHRGPDFHNLKLKVTKNHFHLLINLLYSLDYVFYDMIFLSHCFKDKSI